MAVLVSLNVGLPKDVEWRGRTVRTGAWKQAVVGPRMVRTTNVDGDGQGDLGGHGGVHRAVLVYQVDSYRYWSHVLDRDDLQPGHFGENFTVDGLPDDEVLIGDRYRIGDAVFEVSQPRVTCYRVGLRLDVPKMASLLVSHHRPGFYLRVLSEGEVEAGQEVVKVASGPEPVTVADVDALLYLPGHAGDVLDRALRIPALSPGWRGSLESLAAQAVDPTSTGNSGLTATSPPPAWTGFRPLLVTAIHDESAHVRTFTLAAVDGVPLPSWLPGQSITLRLPAEGGTVLRNYSLSNAPGGEYRIGVKREQRGRASGYLHTRVTVGDQLDVAAPRGTFVLADEARPVLLISAGVGITPVLSMLHQLAESNPTREVWWLHGARDRAESPFVAEVDDLLNVLPNSHFHVWYSRSEGRMSGAALRELGVPRESAAYLCGPAEFMAALTAGLVDHGLDAARIHGETFGAAAALAPGIVGATTMTPHPPTGPAGQGPVVGFARSGLEAPWGPRYESLLEFAEACDVPTRWSCRTGVCHNCETALLSGSVRYDVEPLDAAGEGNVLICCATPVEDVVLDL